MLRRPPLPLTGVLLATLVLFLPALRGQYVDDDLDLVQTSPAFFGIDWLFVAMRAPFWGTELSYWRPLTSALMCVGHWLGGGEATVTHAFALAAHLGATAVAFAILRRLGAGVRESALGAAFFALHPCQVESVAWVAALGDPCAGLFTLLTVLGWLAWRQRGGNGLPWLAWSAFALALASKESGIGALGWIAALEFAWNFGERRLPTIARGTSGLAVVLAVWFGLRVMVFGDWGAGFDRGRIDVADSAAGLFCTGATLWTGFVRMVSGWYGATPYRVFPANGDLGLLALASAVVIPFALAVVSAARRVPQNAVFAGLALAVTLLPAALAPQNLGPWPLVDRYVYSAILAAGILFAGTASVRPALLFALVVVCAVGTATVVGDWRGPERVVQRALRDAPDHPESHFVAGNLARAHAEQASTSSGGEAAVRRFARDAARHYQRALAGLEDPKLHARVHLREVLGFNARLGLAWARSTGGLAQPAAVAAELQSLAREYPKSAQVWLMLGVACVQGGDARGAEFAWKKALEVDPSSHQAAFNLGRLEAQLGNREGAKAMLRRALELHPGNTAAAELLRSLGG